MLRGGKDVGVWTEGVDEYCSLHHLFVIINKSESFKTFLSTGEHSGATGNERRLPWNMDTGFSRLALRNYWTRIGARNDFMSKLPHGLFRVVRKGEDEMMISVGRGVRKRLFLCTEHA